MSGDEKQTDTQERAEGSEQAEGSDTHSSDLQEGMESMGRAFGGVMTQLFGKKITGQDLDPDKPVISEDADKAIGQVGDTLGRLFNAAGRSLKEHPTRPMRALDEASKRTKDDVDTREGETALTEGLRSLAGGLYKTTEAVLDKVAPRKPKGEGEGAEAEGTEE